MNTAVNDVVTQQFQDFNLARSLIQRELTGVFGSEFMTDLTDILDCYNIYDNGAGFDPDAGSGDYVAADHRYKIIKGLIDKEARFLFSIPPTITLSDVSGSNDNDRIAPNQDLIREVLNTNHFNSKLVRAAKDCLIGKRIALALNFNDAGIDVSFIPSLEFIYETDPNDVDIITKFIQFYSIVVNDDKEQQRIYKKKWEINEDGECVVSEEVYDGNAKLVETIMPETVTQFDYIPVWVIVNDGLTGDPFGTSDVEELEDDESWFSRLTSKDFDSLRKGADQIIWAMDVNPKATRNLSRSAGSFWDLNTDPTAEGKTGQVGCLDNDMAYSPALDTSLKRLRASMYSQLDVPDTTSEALQGVISSGKTMEAIYWGLMVRCDEKMLDWKPALVNMIYTIIEGAKLYPNAKAVYIDEQLVDEYTVDIENTYPILRDTNEEKASDILEVNAKTMSRKAYMKKWRGLTDEEVEKELDQIKLEQSMLADDNFNPEPKFMGDDEDGEGEEDE